MHSFPLCASFFLSSAPDHGDLHSFPTRRSSDLRLDGGPGASTAGPVVDPVVGRIGEDRKSTRLNSSHLGISYAVFCLKKKKTGQCSEWKPGLETGRPQARDDAEGEKHSEGWDAE